MKDAALVYQYEGNEQEFEPNKMNHYTWPFRNMPLITLPNKPHWVTCKTGKTLCQLFTTEVEHNGHMVRAILPTTEFNNKCEEEFHTQVIDITFKKKIRKLIKIYLAWTSFIPPAEFLGPDLPSGPPSSRPSTRNSPRTGYTHIQSEN